MSLPVHSYIFNLVLCVRRKDTILHLQMETRIEMHCWWIYWMKVKKLCSTCGICSCAHTRVIVTETM
jgi:hypothetical protein